jgi:hypothetical protein
LRLLSAEAQEALRKRAHDQRKLIGNVRSYLRSTQRHPDVV